MKNANSWFSYFHVHILEKSISNVSWENVFQENFIDTSHCFYFLLLHLYDKRKTWMRSAERMEKVLSKRRVDGGVGKRKWKMLSSFSWDNLKHFACNMCLGWGFVLVSFHDMIFYLAWRNTDAIDADLTNL